MAVPIDIHVHILDGDEGTWKQIAEAVGALRIAGATLTVEASGAAAGGHGPARVYYHAIRYVRLYEELRRSRRPMWILDCDAEVLRDPRPVLSSLRPYDVALRTSPASLDPILKITACSVGLSPTERGLEFARRVAAAIIAWKNLERWGWGVDQTSLFSAYAHMVEQGRAPKTLFLDESAVHGWFGDTGVFRVMAGIEKSGL